MRWKDANRPREGEVLSHLLDGSLVEDYVHHMRSMASPLEEIGTVPRYATMGNEVADAAVPMDTRKMVREVL